MEQSPLETKSLLSSKEILRLLWNRKVHHRVRKGPPLVTPPTFVQTMYCSELLLN
jgi:hypothetical protein